MYPFCLARNLAALRRDTAFVCLGKGGYYVYQIYKLGHVCVCVLHAGKKT